MAIGATDIVAPVFAAPEIVVFFTTCVAGKAGFRCFFRRFVFERDYLCGIAFFCVGFAWPMAGFAAGYFSLPTTDRGQGGMRRMRISFELILMTILTGFTADIISGVVGCGFGLARLNSLRRASRGKYQESNYQRAANEQRLDDSVSTHLSALSS